ncbi:MAG: hypothetical protein RL318_130 [Fibrobacterota bacterium]|jgi:hypothetical protein
MNRALGLLLIALLSSCSTTVPVTSDPVGPGTPIKGWHTAGLVLSEADKDAGGVQRLGSFGKDSLIAVTASGKAFLGQQGRISWDSLRLPVTGRITSMAVADSVIYLGVLNESGIWRYVPSRKEFSQFLKLEPSFRVTRLAWNGGVLTAFIAKDYDTVRAVYRFSGTSRVEIGQGLNDSEATTMSLTTPKVDFATSYSHGLWRRTVEETAWSRLPDPFFYDRYPDGKDYLQVLGKPRALAWYQGNLWVGYLIWSQIHRLSGVDTPWVSTSADSVVFPGRKLPQDIFTLKVLNGRLFGGGQTPGTPMVYVDGSGWRFLRTNWGMSDDGRKVTCGMDITLDFAAIQDTLYVAGCGGVYKLPFDQVP